MEGQRVRKLKETMIDDLMDEPKYDRQAKAAAARKTRISIPWEIDDGYAGGSAPQHTVFDVSELEGCETIDEALGVVEAAIEDDFRNHANPTYNLDKIGKLILEKWKPPKDPNIPCCSRCGEPLKGDTAIRMGVCELCEDL